MALASAPMGMVGFDFQLQLLLRPSVGEELDEGDLYDTVAGKIESGGLEVEEDQVVSQGKGHSSGLGQQAKVMCVVGGDHMVHIESLHRIGTTRGAIEGGNPGQYGGESQRIPYRHQRTHAIVY